MVCPCLKYRIFIHLRKDLLDQDGVQEGTKDRKNDHVMGDKGPHEQPTALQPGEGTMQKDCSGGLQTQPTTSPKRGFGVVSRLQQWSRRGN